MSGAQPTVTAALGEAAIGKELPPTKEWLIAARGCAAKTAPGVFPFE
jgi:hypothetical protein